MSQTTEYKVITKGGQLGELSKLVASSRVIGVDTETASEINPLNPLVARIRLIQIAIGETIFIIDVDKFSVSRKGERRLFTTEFFDFMRDLLTSKSIIKVMHNAKFDCKFFIHEFGIDPESVVDTMLLSLIIAGGDALTHHGLEDVARIYLGVRMDKGEQTSDWSLPVLSESQLRYAAEDARVLVPLFMKMVHHARMDDLLRVAKLEFDCIVPIARMELAGFPLNPKLWREKMDRDLIKRDAAERELLEVLRPGIDWLTKNPAKGSRPVKPKKPNHPKRSRAGQTRATEIGLTRAMTEYEVNMSVYQTDMFEYERDLEAWSGIPGEVPGLINLNSHVQIKRALGNLTGLDWVQLGTGDPVLEQYVSRIPMLKFLQTYRSAEKIVTSYGQNYLDAMDPDGRIRADYRQIGAETGRMSCADPVNLQNPPADHNPDPETGVCPGCHRCCFEAPGGRVFVIADYSQIELRIAADFSGDANMVQAYLDDLDLHRQTADLVGVSRADAKRLNFGIPYGVGPVKFSSQAGISFDEGRDIIANHALTYPGLHGWLRSAANQAQFQRFSRTMSGRIIRFTVPDRCNDFREIKKILSMVGRNGKNGPIQGTSADITKRAVKLVYDDLRSQGGNPQIVNIVHDEIVVEVDVGFANYVAIVLKERMEEAGREFITRVPVKVEVKISERWNK